MLFVVVAVEPCGKFLILLQRPQKYSSVAAVKLRVSLMKNAGDGTRFSADFAAPLRTPESSTDFRGTFPQPFSGIVFPAFRSCEKDHCRPAASDRSCRRDRKSTRLNS